MIYCNIIVIFSVGVQLVDLRVAFLVTGRIVLGIVIGILSSIIPLYLNSITPLSISGKICSLNQILGCTGVIFAYFIGFFITDDKEDEIRWRVMIGFPLLPCIVSIVGLTWFFPFDRLERHIEKDERQIVDQYLKLIYKNATFEDIKR